MDMSIHDIIQNILTKKDVPKVIYKPKTEYPIELRYEDRVIKLDPEQSKKFLDAAKFIDEFTK